MVRAFVSTRIRRGTAALLLMAVVITSAVAQASTTDIRAVAVVAPPFVMNQNGQLSGFCIELWNEIAARLNMKTQYHVEEKGDAMFASVRRKEADVLVVPAFYTAERDREFDFSYPILTAGPQIMVRGASERDSPTPLTAFVNLVFSRWVAMWLGVALIAIVIPGHLVWLLDRGRANSISPNRNYFPGIFHGLHWAATALVAQVVTLPRHWLARCLGLVWMYVGVVFVALYTAQLTATLTTERIRGAINGVSDLPGKRIATIVNTAPERYLRTIGAQVEAFQTTQEMFDALLEKKVDAVFFNSAVLRYYAVHEGRGLTSIVGPEVNRQHLGFVFPLGSPLRKQVGSALIAMREDGTYQRIYEKWFGLEE